MFLKMPFSIKIPVGEWIYRPASNRERGFYAFTAFLLINSYTIRTTMKRTFPCRESAAGNTVNPWAGRLYVNCRKKAFPATRYGRKTGTRYSLSRSMLSKRNLIFSWCSCLTELAVSPMKLPLWWNGLYATASAFGAHRRANSVLIPIRTSSPTISVLASGRRK